MTMFPIQSTLRPFTLALGLVLQGMASGQIVWTEPPFPTQDDIVTLYYDVSQGNGALLDVLPPCPPCPYVYAHTGVITSESTSPSDWHYVQNPWPNGTNTSQANDGTNTLIPLEGTIHTFDFEGLTLAEYYGVPEGVTIEQLAFVFRNGNGEVEGKTADEGDIFYDISDGSFEVIFLNPSDASSILQIGDSIELKATATESAYLELKVDGEIVSTTDSTDISYVLNLEESGDYLLEVVAVSEDLSSTDEALVSVLPPAPPVISPPDGIVDGINYIDSATVILQWHAPYKDYVFAVGDFNGWSASNASLMHDTGDGETFWIEISNLTPGEMYRYQYHILPDDGRYADAYAELILDQWNDPGIPESTYPDLPPYPGEHTSGPVSVFIPGEAAFNWTDQEFNRPDQENLVIYELLVRDFSDARTFQAIEDSLMYLKKLGVQAIELMPVNEFNGNDSWGYNPTFYFAVDKAYGQKSDLQSLVNACHELGIAVILDVVYNHADQPNPFITMYWQNETVLPYNPWFNSQAPHDLTFFYDWNHGRERTRDFVKRNLDHWMHEFHIDGFRWDFSQGIIQEQGVNGAYSEQRIAWMKEYGDHVWAQDGDIYMILEHWCDYWEELELANYDGSDGESAGFMFWSNSTHNYQEGSMGFSDNNFSWTLYTSHGFEDKHAVGYAESHDEERLMYKSLQFGNQNGNYDVSDLATALKRQQLAAAFNILVPGPRLIWQFQELGYDYSINTCSDGVTINDNCRIEAKPVRWDYYDDPLRKELYDVTGALARLKRDFPAFSSEEAELDMDLTGNFKRMAFEHGAGTAIVLGNYGMTPSEVIPGVTHTGWWHNYLTGDSVQIFSLNSNLTLEPGEIRIYLDVHFEPCILDADNDGICDQDEVEGCVDTMACNFDATATDEGACGYPGDGCDDGNDNTFNDQWTVDCECIGMTDDVNEHSDLVTVHPNPSNGLIYLKTTENLANPQGKTNLQLWSADGRAVEVRVKNLSEQIWQLDLTGVPNGMYLLSGEISDVPFSTPVYKITQ